jgi:flavin-dependent dehydrogenase
VGRFQQEAKVIDLERQADGILVTYQLAGAKQQVKAKVVVGAEGEKPVVTKFLGLDHFREKKHLIAALRVYYKGVKGFNSGNHLEFFFDKKLLPGYFWAFPLTNGMANVGLGMVSTAISAKRINLKKMLGEVMERNPHVAEMFAEAEPLEKPQGWGLPIITSKRQIGGDRYALIGDAGGMIEAFTGKGIGPGMMSARILSEHLAAAFKTNNFEFSSYHHHMYRYYETEIKSAYLLQRSLQYPMVLNAVIGLANLAPLKNWSYHKMVKEWNRWI